MVGNVEERGTGRLHRWSRPGVGYLFLWISFFALVLAAPTLTKGLWSALAVIVIYSVLLLSALFLIDRQERRVLAVGLVFIIVSLVLQMLSFLSGGGGLLTISYLSSALTLAFISLTIYSLLFRNREVTTDTIWQGMTLYLLLGLAWANLFAFVNTAYPGSFVDHAHPGERLDLSAFIYYSFVTLTTVGYGDIQPITSEARNLAGFEMLFGVFYLAVFISRLVETWKIERKDQ